MIIITKTANLEPLYGVHYLSEVDVQSSSQRYSVSLQKYGWQQIIRPSMMQNMLPAVASEFSASLFN